MDFAVEQRFLEKTAYVGDCIVWTGQINPGGYGKLRVDKILVYAHRFAWEQVHGPIPPGMHIDHLCRVRICVNVSHLRMVTPQDNWLAPGSLTSMKKFHLKGDVCANGHSPVRYTVHRYADGRWSKKCPACCARYLKDWRARRKETPC